MGWQRPLGFLALLLGYAPGALGVQRRALVQAAPSGASSLAARAAVADSLREVHVLYAVDMGPGTLEGLTASLVSLGRHLEDPQNCHVHLVGPSDRLPELRQLVGCFERLVGRPEVPRFSVHEFLPLPEAMDSYVGKSQAGHRADLKTPVALTRLYLQDYLPSVPRVVWIDYDTIVRADVGQLYRTQMAHAVAAALDHSSLFSYLTYSVPQDSDVIRNLRHPGVHFFNSGVLVVDLDRWRSGNYSAQLEKVAAGLPVHKGEDQLLMNIFFQDDIDVLDKRWNRMNLGDTLDLPAESLHEAFILHWSGCHKPWAAPPYYRELWAPYDFGGQCDGLIPAAGQETVRLCTGK